MEVLGPEDRSVAGSIQKIKDPDPNYSDQEHCNIISGNKLLVKQCCGSGMFFPDPGSKRFRILDPYPHPRF
jgi:hypothetical protein